MSAARILLQQQQLTRMRGSCHPAPLDGPLGTVELGRHGSLPVLGLTGTPAELAVLSRRLAQSGQPALLIADDPATARRALAVSLLPVRCAVFDRQQATPLVVDRLRHRRRVGSRLGDAVECAAALDIDAAGRRAFRTLRRGISGAVATLPRTIREDRRHTWVLLQVTRLLFLRFVESEGWLDGRDDFLRAEFDAALQSGRCPEDELLAPLFFGTLNRSPEQRARAALRFGRIPFLNGGLFEPHLLERRHRWRLPVDAWIELVGLVVDGIEVSLEPDPGGERVTPELIGRVFEGVMEPGERRRSGTYYTPPALVDAAVREAFATHLAEQLRRDPAAVRAALEAPDQALRRALGSLRILDPAVGSGAFLVGALSVLAWRGPGHCGRVRRAVTTALFGVDRNPSAVRIAELRLWLEVLVSLRGRRIERLPPLPNLDRMVRVGDALLDPLSGERIPGCLATRLVAETGALAELHGTARRRAIARVRRLERRAAAIALDAREARLSRLLAETLDHQRAPTLFGDRSGTTPRVRERLHRLRLATRRLRQERRRLALGETTPSFAVESAWPGVHAAGGFDLVVGNPPWVRAERLAPDDRESLRGRYRWWQPSGKGWRHLPDLSVAFVERGMELLRVGGTLGLLLPNKLATVGYATTMRNALTATATLRCVADVTADPRAGFQATTYPMVLVAGKRAAAADHLVRLRLGADTGTVPQSTWRQAGSWSLGGAAAIEVAQRLATTFPPLGTTLRPGLGLKTGANHLFIDPPAALEPWCRPALRGRDISRFRACPSADLLWPADARGRPMAALPDGLMTHLIRHREALLRRSDLGAGPWWRLFRTELATSRWRVVWADLARHFAATALLDSAIVPLNSCYLIAVQDDAAMHALTAWCNARPIGALARLSAEQAANGYARFGARVVGQLPLPDDVLRDPVLVELGAGGERTPGEAIDQYVIARLGLRAHEVEALDAVAATAS